MGNNTRTKTDKPYNDTQYTTTHLNMNTSTDQHINALNHNGTTNTHTIHADTFTQHTTQTPHHTTSHVISQTYQTNTLTQHTRTIPNHTQAKQTTIQHHILINSKPTNTCLRTQTTTTATHTTSHHISQTKHTHFKTHKF